MKTTIFVFCVGQRNAQLQESQPRKLHLGDKTCSRLKIFAFEIVCDKIKLVVVLCLTSDKMKTGSVSNDSA